MITGKEFIQKMYSENNEEERLYSTGCDELDDLLEKAFCDGYEYAQKEFGEKEDGSQQSRKKKLDGGDKAILAGTGTLIAAPIAGSTLPVRTNKKLKKLTRIKDNLRSNADKKVKEEVNAAIKKLERRKSIHGPAIKAASLAVAAAPLAIAGGVGYKIAKNKKKKDKE